MSRENFTPNLLGFGGLMPFFICSAVGYIDAGEWSVRAQTALGAYGAIILTFIGAIHWGRVLTQTDASAWYLWAITPALWAWFALSALPTKTALIALLPGFVAAWWVDYRVAGTTLLPAWYVRLRHQLTLGACAALTLGALAPWSG